MPQPNWVSSYLSHLKITFHIFQGNQIKLHAAIASGIVVTCNMDSTLSICMGCRSISLRQFALDVLDDRIERLVMGNGTSWV